MKYHVDRFFAAVSILAGHGNIKQRLIKAYEGQLEDILEEELPVAAQQTFADLRSQMHRVTPLNGEGPICASVRKMSISEASECAVSVVELYREVSRTGDDAGSVLPLTQDLSERVPPFLVKSV
ncbi:hypothetical protein GWP57_00555 [Gammaproteobacteria bacterium]|jgi:hypothetical protein|nr:hypothetical protein [Gammaproteobacteria bacterium]